MSREFIYIALEKCAGSFDQLIEYMGAPAAKRDANPKLKKIAKLFGATELSQELLLAMFTDAMQGLSFLHSNNIVHRDLKPQNILISKFKRAKISDMGMCKQLTNIEHSFETNASGTWGWQPAEVLAGQKRHSSIDIFSMGCVLYYTLTLGKHPFGDKFSRERNILRGTSDLSEIKDKNYEGLHLIEHMVAFEASRRPTVGDCLNHVLFWDDERKLNFLGEVSNKIEYDVGIHMLSI